MTVHDEFGRMVKDFPPSDIDVKDKEEIGHDEDPQFTHPSYNTRD